MKAGSAAQMAIADWEVEDQAALSEPAAGEAGSTLRDEVAARLKAHRQRRGTAESAAAFVASAAEASAAPAGKRRIARAVAERYAQTPSYRAFLAAEAERAVAEAAARAEIAARNAEAVAVAQGELLAELELWTAPQHFSPASAPVHLPGETARPQTEGSGGLTVRLYEEAGARPMLAAPGSFERPLASAPPVSEESGEEARALDEEIAFRHAPAAQDWRAPGEPTVPMPANLLEFPRQLVATVKARPRLAEGPLREESAPPSPQMRIFEVEPEQISVVPETESRLPEWASIYLDAHVPGEALYDPDAPLALTRQSTPRPLTASLELRAMAAIVDGVAVGAGWLAFVAVLCVSIQGPLPLGLPLGIAAGASYTLLFIAYQLLLLSFAGQTAGMRYARIGFCTLADDNPSRRAMCWRVLAQAASILPLGLGLAWILVDDDRLGWHDRLSRMYQRAY